MEFKSKAKLQEIRSKNNVLKNFEVKAPNKVWTTDITYVRTQEGDWLYVAIV